MCFWEFCSCKLPPLTMKYVLEVPLIYLALASLFLNRIQFCFLRQIHELFLHLIALIFYANNLICILVWPICFTLDKVNREIL